MKNFFFPCKIVGAAIRPQLLFPSSPPAQEIEMKLSSALYFAALSAVVYSHFTLDFPPTRGFDEDEEPKPVCGESIFTG